MKHLQPIFSLEIMFRLWWLLIHKLPSLFGRELVFWKDLYSPLLIHPLMLLIHFKGLVGTDVDFLCICFWNCRPNSYCPMDMHRNQVRAVADPYEKYVEYRNSCTLLINNLQNIGVTLNVLRNMKLFFICWHLTVLMKNWVLLLDQVEC